MKKMMMAAAVAAMACGAFAGLNQDGSYTVKFTTKALVGTKTVTTTIDGIYYYADGWKLQKWDKKVKEGKLVVVKTDAFAKFDVADDSKTVGQWGDFALAGFGKCDKAGNVTSLAGNMANTNEAVYGTWSLKYNKKGYEQVLTNKKYLVK